MYRIALGKHQHEFITPEAGGDIDVPDGLAQTTGECFQDQIARRMAKAIVDLLEIVQIEKYQGKRLSFPLGASDLRSEMALGKSPVIETREWVHQCQILPLARARLPFGEFHTKSIDEKFFVGQIASEQKNQTHQPCHSRENTGMEGPFAVLQNRRQRERGDARSEQEHAEHRNAPGPPFSPLKLA